MKKYSFILWAALTMTSVFTACTDNDTPMTEQNEVKTVTIRATIDGDLGSRVTLVDDAENRVVKVDWAEGDAFKINVDGNDYTFTYSASAGEFTYSGTDFPAAFASAGTVTATYPATAPTEYASQLGTLEGAAGLLTMTATLDVEAGQSTENLALNFKHNNSIVKLTLGNEAFKGKSVTDVTLKSGSTSVAAAAATFTGNADNGSIVAYFAVESKKMANVAILAICEDDGYFVELSDNELQSGKLYNVTKTMESVIKTAEQAVKGDFALKDGSFISRYATLTDEQKAEVAGIVFWTETEDDGPSTLVGDAVADKVMQSDFSYCTHGLIVSLTNVSTSCVWQNPAESVYDSFQNTDSFNPENKANYAAIESGTGSDQYISKILGYNNTKVLEAYNAYCKENNRNEYLVVPIVKLAEWKETNPAPANTTGWFLPSVKELQMLCNKDAADINSAYGKDTKNVVNASLTGIGDVDVFGTEPYWSSSEHADNKEYAFYVAFEGGSVSYYYKVYATSDYVRAVCAY